MNDKFYSQSIAEACELSLKILSDYYHFDSVPKIKNFILPMCKNNDDESRVVFQECRDDFYIGLQFSNQIFDEMKNLQNKLKHYMDPGRGQSSSGKVPLRDDMFISVNTASVIAEESSHFKLIIDAVLYKSKISILEIETLGEIDRFLCLMHWNHVNQTNKIKENWQNICDICDYVFQGTRFKNENQELYIEAENHAFNHLKNAFANSWDYSWYDFSRINNNAVNYFKNIRNKILLNN